MKIQYAILLFIILFGCTLSDEDTRELSTTDTGINYFVYQISAGDVTFIDPYYQVTIQDDRICNDYWLQFWFVANDGSIYQLPPIWDDISGRWYNTIYLYTGVAIWSYATDMIGRYVIVYYAPVTEKGYDDFDALEYLKDKRVKIY